MLSDRHADLYHELRRKPSPVPDWLQIVVACASVFGSIGVLVAVAAFWVQWVRGREERKERGLQLAALQRAEDDRIAAQARRIIPEIASSALFGEDIWIAHIQNASTGAVSQVKVVVEARDADGNEVKHGIRKAKPGEVDISGGLEKLISDALSGGLGGALGVSPVSDLIRQQQQFGGMLGGQGLSLGDQYKNLIAQQVGPEV
jgi:hypothetical protein